ncbi:MAG: enolase C-terminal domain-like protein [Nanoarchaeota archaeon]
MYIKEAQPKIIKNSRKELTIEISIKTLKGKFNASAPSGKSKGKYENPAYNSRGIYWSQKILEEFCQKLKDRNFMIKNFSELENFEKIIKDFESRLGEFGANCTYALETAFLKAVAKENKKELWEFLLSEKNLKIPMPVGNCIGGGLHSHSDEKPDFQEFLLIPIEEDFSKAISKNIEAYRKAEALIKKKEKKWNIKTNDETALQSELSNEETLQILKEVADEFGLKIGIDAASSSFFHNNLYNYKNKRLARKRNEQIDYMKKLIQDFDIFYVEDPMEEEDFSGFAKLSSLIGEKSLIVGDDLTVTNLERLKKAVKRKSINAMIIKPNQNGSILETAKVIDYCKKNGIKTIFSHRSGETMDDALADYAIGFGVDFVKCGVLGKERLVKMGRIIEIEKSLKI